MIDDFRARLLKIHDKRHHEIKLSLSMQDIYFSSRRNGLLPKNITMPQFRKAIKLMNLKIAEYIANGNVYHLPYRMGSIYVEKLKIELIWKDGKIWNNLPIDWKRTIELWGEDNDAYLEKYLVKYHNDTAFVLKYNKSTANYRNKSLMKFNFGRYLKHLVKQNQTEHKLESFIRK